MRTLSKCVPTMLLCLFAACVVVLSAGCPKKDTTPPAAISAFTATPGDGQVALTWNNPADADLAGVVILRKTGSFPATHDDGAIVYDGSGEAATDTGLTNGETYYYAGFVYDEVPNYSTAATVVGEPKDTTPPAAISAFTATPGDGQVALTWNNPSAADLAGVIILRKTGSFPANHNDGAVVHNGPGEAATDTGLTNGETYYYAGFAYDEVPNYSAAATVVGAPLGPMALAEVLEDFDALGDSIDESGLPDDDKQALRDALDESASDYRGDDTCGAADGLLAFADLARLLREGEATAIAEDLFNQGRLLRYNMLLLSPVKNSCAGGERVGLAANALPDDEANNAQELETDTAFGEPALLTFEGGGETFTQVMIPGTETGGYLPGDPAVPTFHFLFAAPQGSTPLLIMEKTAFETAEEIQLNLIPVQEEPYDDGLGDAPPFVKNDDIYKAAGPYPPNPVTITPIGRCRDLEIYAMDVAAGQYDPLTQTLTLFSKVTPAVEFSGGSGVFVPERALSPFEPSTGINVASVVNNAAVLAGLEPYIPPANFMGQELMILTPPLLEEAASTLADWKNEKGIVTGTFVVCDGAGPGPDTIAEIKQLIQDEYDNDTIRPAYILLLGDVNLIPTDYVTPHISVGAPTIASDFAYANLGDAAGDQVPEFAVGRLPAKTLEQATVMVNKIISYESEPPDESAFYQNAAIAAQFQCCRTEVTQDGTAQRTFTEVSEWCRNVMTSHGKVVDRLYRETVSSYYSPRDSTPRRWFDGTLIPAAIGPASGFSWTSGSTTSITNAINDGRFIVIHRDHGGPGSWETPSFTSSDVSALTNGALLPVVFSINCASGFFDNETADYAMGTTPSGTYLCEWFLHNNLGGAVGVFCDSRNSPSWANSALLRGFFDAIWPTAIPSFGGGSSHRRLGDILNHGKAYLATQSGAFEITAGKVTDEIMMWHVLGDPTLELYTGNPHELLIAPLATARVLSTGVLEVALETEGATITAFRQGAAKLVPVARGVVEGGVASLLTIPGEEPAEGSELILSASLANAISRQITVTVEDMPPPDVTNFTAEYMNQGVGLSWTNPAVRDFAGVRIQYRNDDYPTGPTDGENAYDDSGTSTWMAVSPVAALPYYFTAFAYDNGDNYSDGVHVLYTPALGAR